MKNFIFGAFLLFSLCVSAQEWEVHGNGHIKNTNSGNVAIGGGNALDFVGLVAASTATTASQIPAHGWWNFYSSALTTHSGAASKLYGGFFLARLGSSGSLAEMTSVNVEAGISNNAGGTITDAFGVKVKVYKSSGSITNGYGIYIKDIEATNQYGLYQEGTNDVNYFAGNVGIGTIAPSVPLEINYNIQAYPSLSTGLFIKNNAGNDGGQAEIKLSPSIDNQEWTISANDDSYLFRVYSSNVARLAINGVSGNVGIGTTSPDSKLSVNGNIHTKEVKVDLVGWSDFVFENTYILPTLQEVEQHINENGHLKDIPSAKEVKENGIYLGEMNAKLLQKIEELTLYTIEQEKEIKEFKKVADRNEKLEGKVAKLEKLVEQLFNTQK